MRSLSILLCLMPSALPAAQIWDGGGGGERAIPRAIEGVGPTLRDPDARIHDGRRAGQFSRREARRLRRDNDEIGVLQSRYAAGGLSGAERGELDARAQALRGIVDARRLAPVSAPSPR